MAKVKQRDGAEAAALWVQQLQPLVPTQKRVFCAITLLAAAMCGIEWPLAVMGSLCVTVFAGAAAMTLSLQLMKVPTIGMGIKRQRYA